MKLYEEDGKEIKGIIGHLSEDYDPVLSNGHSGILLGWKEKSKKIKKQSKEDK